MTTGQGIIGCLILLAVAVLTNVLCWYGMYRGRADRPWHWTVIVGSFAYHPWLNRRERNHTPTRPKIDIPVLPSPPPAPPAPRRLK